MEGWQRCVIKKNLPELIEITLCNKTLLALLCAEDILSDEERNEIDGTQNYTHKADFLYKVLITRKNAYQLYLKACKHAKQTGVVSILEEGERKHNLLNSNVPATSGSSQKPSYSEIAKMHLISNLDHKILQHMQPSSPREQEKINIQPNLESTNFEVSNESNKKSQIETKSDTPMSRLDTSELRYFPDLNLIKPGINGSKIESIKDKVDFQVWANGLLDNKFANIFAVLDPFGRTPLQSAMCRFDVDLYTVKRILNYSKVDINHKDKNGDTLLHLALSFGRDIQTIKTLIRLGANLEATNRFGSGVLHRAVLGGNQEVIKYLISQGLDINDTNNNGDTPLHFVIYTRLKNYSEITKLLLDNGANIYSKNKTGNTVAHEICLAVTCDAFKLWVTAMIEYGHDLVFTARGIFGRTPLQFAMQRLDLDLATMKLIVESAKLDINQPDDNGDAILHSALEFGRSMGTIKNLIYLGADWNKNGRQDANILSFAVNGSNQEAVLYLKSLGADVDATDQNGQTPLHDVRWTTSKDYLGMTKFLLENGAKLEIKDKQGKSLDQLMSDDIGAEEYQAWKEGMIQLGHANLFTKQ